LPPHDIRDEQRSFEDEKKRRPRGAAPERTVSEEGQSFEVSSTLRPGSRLG
jgi:hypothetical protein